MIIHVRNFSKRLMARIMLFTFGTILSIFLFISAFIGFLIIAKYVFLDNKQEFDIYAFQFLHSHISENTTSLMLLASTLGNYQVMIAANILLTCFFFFIVKHKWYSITIPSTALGSVIIMSLLKLWFNRPRPLTPLLEPAQGLSFPSGHAMTSVTFFGLLIFFVWKKQQNIPLRLAIITPLIILILIIGLSRVYLRVHYASDVLAGFAAGVLWLTLSVTALRRIEKYTGKEIRAIEQARLSETQ